MQEPKRSYATHGASLGRTTLFGDDVIFMYSAPDPATYTAYGCTVLAWGGAAKGNVVLQMESLCIHSTGSLWCLTAGAENLHKDADLRDAVCRDIDKNPIPVWWLFDCNFEGTPTWFGCTNHPAFRAFVRQRVAEEMRGGAPGLHVDDHLGTAHTVAFLGGCFCDHCMTAFRSWLTKNGSPQAMEIAGVTQWADFDFRMFIKKHAGDDATYQKNKESIPLFTEFLDCQLQLAAENVRQLGALAAEIVGHPVTLSANTALPELPHITVVPHLTHLVGEVPHNAEKGSDGLLDAVHAYRMAEAFGKPLAATAKGQDWAWVKSKNSVNLAKIWIALGYCAGQRLMAPHRQWCFTLELGSHWYDGPTHEYAPLYRFVRQHPDLFRQTATLGPLCPPTGVSNTFNTAIERESFQKALAEGNPRPLHSARIWIFPRRAADGSLIVHLLNLDYSPEGDSVKPAKNLELSLESYGIKNAAAATLYFYDADPVSIPILQTDATLFFTVPELRIWAILRIPAK